MRRAGTASREGMFLYFWVEEVEDHGVAEGLSSFFLLVVDVVVVVAETSSSLDSSPPFAESTEDDLSTLKELVVLKANAARRGRLGAALAPAVRSLRDYGAAG